ncbi:MAG TPA: tryptophan halogenase family protein [Candidatus Angelobacter sp.]
MKKVKSVVIVGGGSSGWMSAAYLSRVLFDLDITLVESRNTPRIGVGEATTPILTRFMQRLGFDQWESWLPEVDGTIKTGILFENWYEKGDWYWHPFEALDYLDHRHHIGHGWLQLNRNGDPDFPDRSSFYRAFYLSTILNCECAKRPVLKNFAFHINADLFADFLRKTCPKVRHVMDDVTEVRLNPAGEIEGLVTSDHGILKADLFIDCTGFRRKLIRQVDPHQPYESYAESLFCNRAVVLRFPYGENGSQATEMHPYVKASAQSSGWTWTIPLFSRISSGYVYSSSFLSDEEAERELREYWGYQRTKDVVPLKVKFESGKLKDLWVKNCVPIGLAGSFVEPLESTGLAITQVGLELLASILDARCYDDAMQARYNMHLQKFCDDVKQFIIAHYFPTNREDTPFWRAVKHDTKIPDDLAARLEVFRTLLPTDSTKGTEEWWFFRDISWFSVLLGMNYAFKTPQLDSSLMEKAKAIASKRLQVVQEHTKNMPSHFDYLNNRLYGPRERVRQVLKNGIGNLTHVGQ